MDVHLRPGTPSDAEAIRGFTADTFEWGDYVADEYLRWLEEDTGLVAVAVTDDQVAVAVARIVLPAPAEAWLHAARVHPRWRRRGIGTRVNDYLLAWAKERGVRIARLLTEDWNTAAIAQVESLGYRPVAGFSHLRLDLGSEPRPSSNGGRRVPGPERLIPAPPTEAEPAWVVWSTGGPATAAHQLYPIGWVFRTMRIDHVREAAARHELWQAPSGWVIATSGDEDWHVSWVATTDTDVRRLLRAVIDRASDLGSQRLTMLVPRWEPLVTAAAELGFDSSASTLYATHLTPEA